MKGTGKRTGWIWEIGNRHGWMRWMRGIGNGTGCMTRKGYGTGCMTRKGNGTGCMTRKGHGTGWMRRKWNGTGSKTRKGNAGFARETENKTVEWNWMDDWEFGKFGKQLDKCEKWMIGLNRWEVGCNEMDVREGRVNVEWGEGGLSRWEEKYQISCCHFIQVSAAPHVSFRSLRIQYTTTASMQLLFSVLFVL